MADDVVTGLDGDVGRITLGRPRALNALTTDMVARIDGALQEWTGLGLRAVVIESDSDNFCAGGDVRALRELALDGRWADIEAFFSTEYRMNQRLAEYPVPVVSLIDGMCMGGGMGLSVHGTYRVVTERAVMAMPETMIGFLPDVGATYFLSHLPGALGLYLGLTGYRMTAADALDACLATHHAPSARLRELADALVGTADAPEQVLAGFASSPAEPSALAAHRAEINAAFSAPDVGTTLEYLTEMDSPWSLSTAAQLRGASPTSLAVTHELIRLGRRRSLRECLYAEREAAVRMVRHPDFAEGVRAGLVDKDRKPSWASPAA
ncbi:enoyl-CoA hydratase/isomerase family protein [soil metagenome]